MKLLAQKLPEPESCRGIVRVSKAAMNISPGDYIVIAGKKSTCAKVWRAGRWWCSEHAGENADDAEMIWMDRFAAKNAGISFGEKVSIHQAFPSVAEFVELSCKEALSDHTVWPSLVAKNEEGLIKLVARGRALAAGEMLAVKGPSSNLPVVFRVLKTVPDGFVLIGDETEIEVRVK